LSGRLEVAADLILRAGGQLTIDPVLRETLVNMLIRQASLAEANDDVVGALRYIKAVCILEPSNRAANSNLNRLSQLIYDTARKLLENGDIEQSLTKFKQATEIDPTNEKLLLQLAKVSETNGAWIEAANIWLKLSRQNAERHAEYVGRACRVARKSDDHDKALEVFVEARASMDVCPAEIGEWGDVIARKVYKSGKESFDEGHIELAFERVTALIKWDRESELVSKLGSRVENRLAKKLKEVTDEKVDATKLAYQMLSLNPSQSTAIRYMARKCFDRGSYAEAANWYKALVEKVPDEEQAWNRWLRCHAALLDFENGRVVAEAMARRFPSNKNARVFLSKIEERAA
jgi:tetratricopeptide (TPR) repeat protein